MASAVFPNGVKTWTDKVNGMDDVSADHINEAYAEIIAIENQFKIQFDEMGIYGLRHKISTDSYTRLNNAVGKVANPNGALNDFDNIMPWAGIKRCNLADDLSINAYYGDTSYIEDGSNGQVMVEVPVFYYKRYYVGTDDIYTYISPLPISGFKRHPWFYDANGNPVDKKYFSAYEGSLYDVSASAYILNDSQVADFTATTGDKLCSVANAKPCSGQVQNLTLPNSRILARNRGNDWQQQYFNAVSAIQMLFSVEYASFNSQSKIGLGVVNKADDGATNCSIVTGGTASLGNKSGKAVGTDGLVSISYRGIENFWGNIWKWVDGINISNTSAFVSKINGNFASDVFSGSYKNVGQTLKNANGYFSKSILNYNTDFAFLPGDAVGTSNSYFADYFYQNGVGSFVALLGGGWSGGARAGAFSWSVDGGSSDRSRTVGARLCV